ncbi:MAG: hypothetical protein NVS3B5_02980 [Sphingomicrobium sp.]
MRSALFLVYLPLAACSAGVPPGPPPGTFAGVGRDRLCIAGAGEALRAGLIAYAADGAANCSLAGKLEQAATEWTLIPKGDSNCRIGLSLAGNKLAIANVRAGCSYYCGPGASLAGKVFTRDPKASPAVDLAGDPLC